MNGLARIADSGEAREEFVNEERNRAKYDIQGDDGILCTLAIERRNFSLDK